MKVYIKTDTTDRITAINSEMFIADTSGWVLIDEGEGDKYMHAQNHYFPLPLIDEYGVYRYKLVDGQPIERTPEEMETDRPEPPEPEETTEDLTLEMLVDHEYRLCMIELGIY